MPVAKRAPTLGFKLKQVYLSVTSPLSVIVIPCHQTVKFVIHYNIDDKNPPFVRKGEKDDPIPYILQSNSPSSLSQRG